MPIARMMPANSAPRGTMLSSSTRSRRLHDSWQIGLSPSSVGTPSAAAKLASDPPAETTSPTGAPSSIGAEVTVTIEIEARLPNGATDQLVRTVTENSRTLKFDNQGFEKE
ncbi:MAG: hypothetical protein ACREF3_02950 [Acetobacteraceae bacterium]